MAFNKCSLNFEERKEKTQMKQQQAFIGKEKMLKGINLLKRLEVTPITLEDVIKNEENIKNTPYKEVITRGYLIAFLGKLFCSMEFREEKQSDGTLLKSILNYCNKHCMRLLR